MSLKDILAILEDQYGAVRCVELGKIKIGSLGSARKSRTGGTWRMPVKLDHFVITTNSRDDSGDLIIDEKAMAGLKRYADPDGHIRQLPVRVLSDDLSDIITARYLWYGKKSAGAISDGRTVEWRFDRDTLTPLNPPRVEPWSPEHLKMMQSDGKGGERPLFKLHFIARFVLTIGDGESRWGGSYVFRSTSVISLRQLHASVSQIQAITAGILTGINLFLVVRQIEIDGPSGRTKVDVVHLEARGDDIQRSAMRQARFRIVFKERLEAIQKEYRKLLVAPGAESEEEAGFIQQEFSPGLTPAQEAAGDDPEKRYLAIKNAWVNQIGSKLPANTKVGVAFWEWFYSTVGLEIPSTGVVKIDATGWMPEWFDVCEGSLNLY